MIYCGECDAGLGETPEKLWSDLAGLFYIETSSMTHLEGRATLEAGPPMRPTEVVALGSRLVGALISAQPLASTTNPLPIHCFGTE